MLQRKYRLPAYAKLNNSHVVVTHFFIAKYQKNILGYNRFGFVVSKQVDKRATIRNRVKRIVRSSVEDKTTLGSYDTLFVLKRTVVAAARKEIENEMGKVVKLLSNLG